MLFSECTSKLKVYVMEALAVMAGSFSVSVLSLLGAAVWGTLCGVSGFGFSAIYSRFI